MSGNFQSQVTKKSKFKREWVPQYVVSATYGKALVRGFNDLSVEKALQRLSREMLKQIRGQIAQTVYSPAAKKRLAKALKVEMHPRSLRIKVLDPLWGYLIRDYSTGPYTMAWLQKATRPIPIVLDNGEVIFRNATPNSMKNGKWVHPGRPAITLTEKAKKEAKKLLKQRFTKEVVQLMQERLG